MAYSGVESGAVILVTSGVPYLLVVLFAMAIWSKVAFLRGGAAQWHPVLVATPWRRRNARVLLGGAAVADGLAILSVIFWRPVVVVVIVPLIAAYTTAALTAPGVRLGEARCHCFAGFLDGAGASHLIVRNVLVAALAVIASLHTERSLTPLAVASGACWLAVLAALPRVAGLIGGGQVSTPALGQGMRS